MATLFSTSMFKPLPGIFDADDNEEQETPIVQTTNTQRKASEFSFIPKSILEDENPSTSNNNWIEEDMATDDWEQELTQTRPNPVASTSKSVKETIPTVMEPSSALYGEPIKAYSFDGKPLFFPRKARRVKSKPTQIQKDEQVKCLLDVPVRRLMETLSHQTAMNILEPTLSVASTSKHTQANDSVDNSLWTDRYRPQKYTDLLGEEKIHREILAWVKEWDFCVFGKQDKRKKEVDPAQQRFDPQDQHRRPREKILLISGPPGLGKTTLAHVIATHAKYDVLEVNASDARSGQSLDDRIRPALEAGTKLGSNKPVLVVIDEIDGATGGSDNTSGFVHKLIALAMEKPKKKGRGKDKKDGKRPLLRPIICICNDLYASSLSKLRPITRIIRLQKTSNVHISRRLQQICGLEGLRADPSSLSTLIAITEGDMRSCLNTLQLIRTKHREVNEDIVRNSTIGMKESDQSFSVVINDIFAPLSKTRTKQLGLTMEQESKYLHRMVRGIDGSGTIDKIALSCFEHYATLRHHDANFRAYEQANEWLATYDTFNGAMRSDREYALIPYLAYPLAAFHPLFAAKGGIKVERPKVDWEAFVKQKTNEEIYKSVQKNVATAGGGRRAVEYQRLVQTGILQLEFIPLLNRIISPPIRPVNHQVIKPNEKLVLSRLVDIMVALELRFVKEKTEEGQMVYRLDPPIDVFSVYDGKKASDITVSSYATRHLIAGEIDAQLILRDVEGIEQGKDMTTSDFFRKQRADKASGPANSNANKPAQATTTTNRKRTREDFDTTEAEPVDFFGRPLKPSSKANTKNKTTTTAVLANQPKRPSVAYKYNEGSSSAVRKPIKISALLF